MEFRSNVNKKLDLAVLVFSLLTIVVYIPNLLKRAEAADTIFRHTVPTAGDDHEYQIQAVNLLHGFGFADSISLPLETYHLDLSTKLGARLEEQYREEGLQKPSHSFYRGPGLPLLLSATYWAFGNRTIVARRLLATLVWLTAVVLVLAGAYMAGWIGSLAGGVAALYYVNYFAEGGKQTFGTFGHIMTEIPSAFGIAFFVLLFLMFVRKKAVTMLILASVSYLAVVFARSNFIVALPFLLLYLCHLRRPWREFFLMGAIVVIPVGLWSLYASVTLGRWVGFTTQGEIAFPQFNNIGVLNGVGPERAYQGEWNPGFELDKDGNWILPTPYKYGLEPGENGWIKGLTFWKNNLTQLPRLFYLKLWRNFWYDGGGSENGLCTEGIYLVGIGFLLLSLGFRASSKPRLLPAMKAEQVLLLQLGLVTMLFVFWNYSPFWAVLVVWFFISAIAVLHPYGEYPLVFQPPAWFLAFIACHAVVTMLFGYARFHQPVDPPLMLFGILGTLLSLRELMCRNRLCATLFLLVIVGTTLTRYRPF